MSKNAIFSKHVILHNTKFPPLYIKNIYKAAKMTYDQPQPNESKLSWSRRRYRRPRELKQTQRKTEIMLSQFFRWLKNKTRLQLAYICWKQQCYKMDIIFCEKYEVLQQNRHFWNQHPKLSKKQVLDFIQQYGAFHKWVAQEKMYRVK